MRLPPENTKLIPQIDIDEMKELAKSLEEIGVDYISLSLWEAKKVSDKHANDSSHRTVVEQFRGALKSSALIASGKIWTHQEATAIFDLGADFVAIGSAAIANPNWPQIREPSLVKRFPLSRAELNARFVSDDFVEYLKAWNFVSDEAK